MEKYISISFLKGENFFIKMFECVSEMADFFTKQIHKFLIYNDNTKS